MAGIPFEVVIAVVTLVGSAAVTFGAVRAALNGTRETVKAISTTLDGHVAADHAAQLKAIEVSTRIETKLEAVLERERERERERDAS